MFQPEIETMSREALRTLRSERLHVTVRVAYERVPFYRQRFDEAGVQPDDIRRIEDIERLPFTQKSHLRDHYPFGLLAVQQKDIVRIHASSGTKGKPTVVAYTKRDIENWADCVARSIVTAGGAPGDIFQVAYGYGLFTGGLGFHYGAERLGMTVVPVSGGNTSRQVTLIEDLRPRGIGGTPSYVLHVAETMEAVGKDARLTSLEYGIFGAEPWSQEMRRALEQKLGIKAVDVYGLSEVMGPGVSIECVEAQDGMHVAEDHFFMEIVNPTTGEAVPCGEYGEIVITSLTKEALPVVRYRTGDIAYLYPELCSCGRTHMKMSRIKGRLDDMLIIRGVNVFPSEIESIIFNMPDLGPNYQIIVDRNGPLDELNVLVEINPSLVQSREHVDAGDDIWKSLRTKLLHEFKNKLGIGTSVTLCEPGQLPRSEGKALRVVDKRHLY